MKFKVGDMVQCKKGTLSICYWTDAGKIVGCYPDAVHGWVYSIEFPNEINPMVVAEQDLELVTPWAIAAQTANANPAVPPVTSQNTTAAHFGIDFSTLKGDSTWYNDVGITFKEKSCECGTKNAKGQGHSHWCPIYNKEM